MFDLSTYQTFALQVYCEHLVSIESVQQLQDIITQNNLQEPYVILGSGSDVLFTEDFKGTVLVNSIKGFTVNNTEQGYIIRAGGGVLLDDLISTLVDSELNISGLENLSLIPGTVGAAPIQNVGAYDMSFADHLVSVEAINMRTGQLKVFSKQECNFAYRTSIFKQVMQAKAQLKQLEQNKKHKLTEDEINNLQQLAQQDCYFITHVNLLLPKIFTPVLTYAGLKEHALNIRSPLDVRNIVIALRQAKLPDPKELGNAGSFFKNPVVSADKYETILKHYDKVPAWQQSNGDYKLAAGWLIDKAGCRGIRHGNVGTYPNQALVIVNYGQAKPKEVLDFAYFICEKVRATFGIELEIEVRLYEQCGEIAWIMS